MEKYNNNFVKLDNNGNNLNQQVSNIITGLGSYVEVPMVNGPIRLDNDDGCSYLALQIQGILERRYISRGNDMLEFRLEIIVCNTEVNEHMTILSQYLSYTTNHVDLGARMVQRLIYNDFHGTDNKAGWKVGSRVRYGNGDKVWIQKVTIRFMGVDRAAIPRQYISSGDSVRALQDERKAYMTFDEKLISAKYSYLGKRNPLFTIDGLCIPECMEGIKSDGEYLKAHQGKHIADIEQQCLLASIRQTFDKSEIDDIYQGNLMGALSAYKRHFPVLDFGYFDCDISAKGTAFDLVEKKENDSLKFAFINCHTRIKQEEEQHEYILRERFIASANEEEKYENSQQIDSCDSNSSCVQLSEEDEEEKMSDIQPPMFDVIQVDQDQEQEKLYLQNIAKRHPWWVVYEKMHILPLSAQELFELMLFLLQEDKKKAKKIDLQKKRAARLLSVPGNDHKLPSSSKKGVVILKGVKSEDKLRKKFNKRKNKNITWDIFCNINDWQLSPQQTEIRKQEINAKIDLAGVAVIDLETVIDNAPDYSFAGNCVPIVLHAYGTMSFDADLRQKNDSNFAYDPKIDIRVQLIKIDISFEGKDCMYQFVRWLMLMGAIVQQGFTSFLGTSANTDHRKYLKKFKNRFYAHNGARFDFRFLIDAFSRIANIKLKGDITHMKEISFKNIVFQDFYLLMPFSLSQCGTQLGCVNQKFPYDIENVTKDNWQDKKVQIIKYCRMDCMALHEACVKYIKKRAITYHVGRGFPSQIYPATASAGSLNTFQSCYLQEDIKTFPETFRIELLSRIGGNTTVYRSCMYTPGKSFDGNSQYPAAMLNLMPVRPIMIKGQFVQNFTARPLCYIREDSPLYEEQQKKGGKVKMMCRSLPSNLALCEVEFIFPADCPDPSLPEKQNHGSVIYPLESHKGSGIWIWGHSINFAIQRWGACVRIKRMIEYEGSHIFREFISELYDLRVRVKSIDKIHSVIIKLDMNGLYGKWGQKINPKSEYGNKQMIEDQVNILEEQYGVGQVEFISCQPLLTANEDIIEIKYWKGDEEITQIGGAVRLASYIASLARTNLSRLIHLVITEAIKLGLNKKEAGSLIKYSDTDSGHFLFFGFTEEELATMRVLSIQAEDITELLEVFDTEVETIKKNLTLISEELYSSDNELLLMKKTIKNGSERCTKIAQVFQTCTGHEQIVAQLEIERTFYVDNDNDAANVQIIELEDNGEYEYDYTIIDKVSSMRDKFYKDYYKQEIYGRVKEIYDQNVLSRALCKIKDIDPRNMDFGDNYPTGEMLPLLDKDICGAYKEEKFIMFAIYAASKSYVTKCFDAEDGNYSIDLKMKGVAKKQRAFDQYANMFRSFQLQEMQMTGTTANNVENKEFTQIIEQTKFRVLHTGVRISKDTKCIQSTLIKRKYEGTYKIVSSPWKNGVEYMSNQIATYAYKQQQGDIVKAYIAEERLSATATSLVYWNEKESSAKDKIIHQYSLQAMQAMMLEMNQQQSQLVLFDNSNPFVNAYKRRVREEPRVFSKLFVFSRLRDEMSISQLQAGNITQQLSQIYLDGLIFYIDKFSTRFDRNTCKAITNTEKSIVQSHFLSKLSAMFYNENENPYSDILGGIIAKIEKNLANGLEVYLHDSIHELVSMDFECVLKIVQQFSATAPELGQLQQYECKLWQMVERSRGWSCTLKNHNLYKEEMQKRQNVLQQEVIARIQMQKKKMIKLVENKMYGQGKRQINVLNSYGADFMLIWKEFEKRHQVQDKRQIDEMCRLFTYYKYLYSQNGQSEGCSQQMALLEVIRKDILYDNTILTVNTWDKDYSKTPKVVKIFLEKIYTDYFTSGFAVPAAFKEDDDETLSYLILGLIHETTAVTKDIQQESQSLLVGKKKRIKRPSIVSMLDQEMEEQMDIQSAGSQRRLSRYIDQPADTANILGKRNRHQLDRVSVKKKREKLQHNDQQCKFY